MTATTLSTHCKEGDSAFTTFFSLQSQCSEKKTSPKLPRCPSDPPSRPSSIDLDLDKVYTDGGADHKTVARTNPAKPSARVHGQWARKAVPTLLPSLTAITLGP